MKTLEQLAAETFPCEGLCPSKMLTAKYNQAKMVKAVKSWISQQVCYSCNKNPLKHTLQSHTHEPPTT